LSSALLCTQGGAQLAADVEYFCNVMSALQVSLSLCALYTCICSRGHVWAASVRLYTCVMHLSSCIPQGLLTCTYKIVSLAPLLGKQDVLVPAPCNTEPFKCLHPAVPDV
jgi:hypothetical protein